MDSNRSELVSELVDRWAPRLASMPWTERLDLLADIHEQLFEDVGNLKRFAEISPQFIAGLITRWGTPFVVCEEQAHIYANSESHTHRAASGDWFSISRCGPAEATGPGSWGQTPRPSIDRRRSPRVIVDRPMTVVASGEPLGCRLVDISTGGAGIEVNSPLSLGARVEIELPQTGRAFGNVVRAEPPSFGLAFATPISPETVAALQ